MITNVYAACSVIEDLENRNPEHDEVVEAFQFLIDTGDVWNLQGFYGRAAGRLIEDGECLLARERAEIHVPQGDRPDNVTAAHRGRRMTMKPELKARIVEHLRAACDSIKIGNRHGARYDIDTAERFAASIYAMGCISSLQLKRLLDTCATLTRVAKRRT